MDVIRRGTAARRVFACAGVVALCSELLSAQTFDRIQKQRALQMLANLKTELKKRYYDPTFGGADIDAHLQKTADKIDAAPSYAQAMAIIAQAFVDLNDSHTRFIPPMLSVTVEYGWQVQMYGDTCFVTAVKPGSDADKQGLKTGDLVVSIDGFRPTRRELWKLQYAYYTLRPRSAVSLVVRTGEGAPRTVLAASKITQGRRTLDLSDPSSMDVDGLIRDLEREAMSERHVYVRFADVTVWKMPTFNIDPNDVDKLVDEVTKNTATLILDLRGNPGGFIRSLERFTGRFFDRDLQIAQMKGRKSLPPMLAKKRDRTFTGNLIVLVDGRSASAAEIFARLVQIEKRGTVIGDRTSGAVMMSTTYSGEMGVDKLTWFGAAITEADVIMSDGKSLEHTGVTPDEVVVPTGADLAASADPVLARAAAKAGLALDAKRAGAVFPIEWR